MATKGDVKWYIPGKKKPCAYSTVATRDTINCYAEQGYRTPNQMMYAIEKKIFIRFSDVVSILRTYIDNGYGDEEF